MAEYKQKCNNCGHTDADFVSTGFLGCTDCFTALAETVNPVLTRMFGHATHMGKAASEADGDYTTAERLAMLEAELRIAVRNERYQDAAKIKSQIEKLESEAEK
ncbi:MAG: UvrB/UvrC motif-containing protein [Firmicutes bacterium]|nr:UvrB/UvrC motif-containing protein [Bacillota bacterium]